VDHALLNGLVEGGNGLPVNHFCAGFVAFGQSFTQLSQRTPQAGSVGAVAHGSGLSLSGALQRRKMVRHVWFVTFVSMESLQMTAEYAILLE
jgi:hypothetical protein